MIFGFAKREFVCCECGKPIKPGEPAFFYPTTDGRLLVFGIKCHKRPKGRKRSFTNEDIARLLMEVIFRQAIHERVLFRLADAQLEPDEHDELCEQINAQKQICEQVLSDDAIVARLVSDVASVLAESEVADRAEVRDDASAVQAEAVGISKADEAKGIVQAEAQAVHDVAVQSDSAEAKGIGKADALSAYLADGEVEVDVATMLSLQAQAEAKGISQADDEAKADDRAVAKANAHANVQVNAVGVTQAQGDAAIGTKIAALSAQAKAQADVRREPRGPNARAFPCHFAHFRETLRWWGYDEAEVLQHYGAERIDDLFQTPAQMEALLKDIKRNLRPTRYRMDGFKIAELDCARYLPDVAFSKPDDVARNDGRK